MVKYVVEVVGVGSGVVIEFILEVWLVSVVLCFLSVEVFEVFFGDFYYQEIKVWCDVVYEILYFYVVQM